MLEPDVTPDDFNELTNSIEHDNWLNGVEIGHDGELVSIDTPYAVGFEKHFEMSEEKRTMVILYWRDTMNISQAQNLVLEVRNVRRDGFTPTIAVSREGFEYFSDFWPRFMFLRTEKKVERGLTAWVKRLVRIEVKDTLITVLPSNIHTEYIKEQIMKEQALPIDGVWVPCEVGSLVR